MSAADSEQDGRKSGDDDHGPSANTRQLMVVDNCLESRDLFVGTRDVVILHGREAYHLRLTAQNKLILTK